MIIMLAQALTVLLLLVHPQLSSGFTNNNIINIIMPPSSSISQRRSASSMSETAATTINNDNADDDPQYTFGLLTDIQHAPIPDGHSYTGNARYYRHAIHAASYAAQHFQEEKVDVVINLGDIIDGKCADVLRWGGDGEEFVDGESNSYAEEKKSSSSENSNNNNNNNNNNKGVISVGHNAIDNVLQSLSAYTHGPILHTYGNHELYNLSREKLGTKLNIPFTKEECGDLVGYYSCLIGSNNNSDSSNNKSSSNMKLRAVILDSYDLCLLDRCPTSSKKRHRAHEILSKHNHNYPHNENSPEGLEGLSRRFVGFNGGIDEPQLEWLHSVLSEARTNNEKVLLFSHQPIHPESSWPTCLIWNYDEVLDILRSYSDVVLASFAGHAHKGGYVRDDVSGIHFRTVEAVLESSPPIRTYAIVDVFDDRLVIRGEGDCLSDVYELDHAISNKG
jgi:manganese-dependent ADP-ribose/CDP-alcohol diphosphatase